MSQAQARWAFAKPTVGRAQPTSPGAQCLDNDVNRVVHLSGE
jgi:hypothetical protein